MQDNGRGMPHDDIPNMFGRGLVIHFHADCSIESIVLMWDASPDKAYSDYCLCHCHVTFLRLKFLAVLSGTKYGLKQTRGKFGLGAKMVCLTCGVQWKRNHICDWKCVYVNVIILF